MKWDPVAWNSKASPAPNLSPSEPQFSICKMKRADPDMAGVQKYTPDPDAACSIALPSKRLCQSTSPHPVPRSQRLSYTLTFHEEEMALQRGDGT